ncbi:MAG: NAD-dependent deacylase [Acidobacteria bacterium]|nr:NAD-dependent deacylase [Acidobacteriota bacterium]
MTQESIAALVEALASARHVVALTGAGVSAESGVPTFRGAGGLWRGRDATELATPEAFAADPKLVWEFYDWRRTLLAGCSPNGAHRALAALEASTPRFTLVTQNVDGLHRLAGSRDPLELHGNIWRVRCWRGCGEPEREDRRAPLPPPLPPPCACGAPLRPGVVWFGEMLPVGAFERAARAAREAGVFLVAGTSGVVEPAASLARVARSAGARVVEINPDPTPLTRYAHDVFREPASAALERLVAALEARA